MRADRDGRLGLLTGTAAYLLWGLFPIYWPLLKPAGAIEILAHRFVWSLFLVVGILLWRAGWGWLADLLRRPKQVAILVAAGLLIAANWGTYIYGVNNHHVVETSLGYFINPLVTVLLAVGVLHERLRRVQWAALGLGAVAVTVLTVDYGRLPWIALTLAFSFGTYGLLKKVVAVDAVQSLAVETAVLFVPAVAYLWWLHAQGTGGFGRLGAGHSLLLMSAGVVTAVPLLLFGTAARRLPLATLGLLQYLAPILQFLFGVLVFHEPMPAARLVGFVLVWLALAVITVDGVRNRRRPQPAAESPRPATAAAATAASAASAAGGAGVASAARTPGRRSEDGRRNA